MGVTGKIFNWVGVVLVLEMLNIFVILLRAL